MRSASVTIVLTAATALAGCGLLTSAPLPQLPTADMAAPPKDPAAGSAGPAEPENKPEVVAEVPAARPAAPPPPPLPPVDANTQRAFDAAVQALRAGRVDEAERALKALALVQPQLAGVHANLALIHRRAGRDAEAVAALEEAVKLSPRQPLYLNQLGIAYRHAGLFTKAREAYERAIELDAGYAAPQLNLAILLDLYLADRARAAEWYQRSAVLLPGDAPQINKWLADLKNRKPEASVASASNVAVRKEKE
jgi:tetratricopeptide (TPR) repeat protein